MFFVLLLLLLFFFITCLYLAIIGDIHLSNIHSNNRINDPYEIV